MSVVNYSRTRIEIEARPHSDDLIIHYDSQDIAEDLVGIPGKHLPEARGDYTATLLQPIQVERPAGWEITGWSLLGSVSGRPYATTARFHHIADLDTDLMPYYFRYTAEENQDGG